MREAKWEIVVIALVCLVNFIVAAVLLAQSIAAYLAG